MKSHFHESESGIIITCCIACASRRIGALSFRLIPDVVDKRNLKVVKEVGGQRTPAQPPAAADGCQHCMYFHLY